MTTSKMQHENVRWPDGFYDIGNQTFEWVYENRPDWVEFTIEKMSQTTGMFKMWSDFVTFRKGKCLNFCDQQR